MAIKVLKKIDNDNTYQAVVMLDAKTIHYYPWDNDDVKKVSVKCIGSTESSIHFIPMLDHYKDETLVTNVAIVHFNTHNYWTAGGFFTVASTIPTSTDSEFPFRCISNRKGFYFRVYYSGVYYYIKEIKPFGEKKGDAPLIITVNSSPLTIFSGQKVSFGNGINEFSGIYFNNSDFFLSAEAMFQKVRNSTIEQINYVDVFALEV